VTGVIQVSCGYPIGLAVATLWSPLAGKLMKKIAFAFVCFMGAAMFAPSASAAEMSAPAPTAAVVVEAPIEAPVAQDCRRRPGRMSFMRSCANVDGDASGGPQLSASCAPRVAYRGHRRVLLPIRVCRPLFSSQRSDA